MRRLLGPLLSALLLGSALGACGEDEAGTVTDGPKPSASTSPSGSPTKGTGEPVDFDLVEMITETAAGGDASPTAVPLGDETAVGEFIDQFKGDGMRTRILDVVQATKVPDDKLLYAAVVAIGCDSPEEVTVTSEESGLAITAVPGKSPPPECYAPMTTVALVLVPVSAAG